MDAAPGCWAWMPRLGAGHGRRARALGTGAAPDTWARMPPLGPGHGCRARAPDRGPPAFAPAQPFGPRYPRDASIRPARWSRCTGPRRDEPASHVRHLLA